MAEKKYDNEDGRWVTIGGRKVFIKNGQSVSDAMKESGKFKSAKKEEKPVNKAKEAANKYMAENYEKKKKEMDDWLEKSKEIKGEDDTFKKASAEREKGGYDDKYRGDDYWDLSESYENGDISKEELVSDLTDMYNSYEGANKAYKEITGEDFPKEAVDEFKKSRLKYVEDKDKALAEASQKYKVSAATEEDYELYKQARENPNEINPMTEYSTDWEELDKKYKDRYEKEQKDPYDDPESGESQRLQDIQRRYDEYLQETENRGASYGELAYVEGLRGKELDDFEKELDEFEEKGSSYYDNLDNYEIYEQAEKLANETKDYELRSEINKRLDRIDRANRRGSGYGEKPTNELREMLKNNENENHLKDVHDKTNPSKEENIERQRLISEYRQNASKEDYLKLMDDTIEKDISNDEIRKMVNEAKKSNDNKVKFTADEDDILERYSKDFGYDDEDRIKNLKGQIDYMRNPGDSINKTAQRLVEGGDFLIYNEDVKDYLRERNIKFNDDNFFDVYKKEMAEKIENLYNRESEAKTTNDIMNEKIRATSSKKASATKSLSPISEDKGSSKTTDNNYKLPSNEDIVKEYNNYSNDLGKKVSKDKFAGEYAKNLYNNGKIGLADIEQAQQDIKNSLKAPKTTNEIMNNAIRQKTNKTKTSKAAMSDREVNNIKSQKALRSLADEGKATNITRLDDKKTKALREKHGGLEVVKVTKGTYGMNGALLRSSKTGEYFVIDARNSNLFYWV